MPVSAAIKTHLQGTLTLGVFMDITAKDGDVLRVWNGTRNKIVDGQTYFAYPISPSRLQASNGLQADNLEITAVYSGLFTAATLRAKKWQGARVQYRILNYKDFSMGYAERRVGFVGKTTVGKRSAKPELNSLSSKLGQTNGRTCNRECDVDRLADARCGVNLNGNTVQGHKIKVLAHIASVTNRQQFTVALDQDLSGGLLGQYYTYSGTPAFTTLIHERVDATINYDWSGQSPAPGVPLGGFAVRFTGFVVPQYSENYTFEIEHDDGARLWVDSLVTAKIDQWATLGTHSSASFAMTAGVQKAIKLEMFQSEPIAANPTYIKLRWSSPSQPLEVIPSARLVPPTGLTVSPMPDGFYERGVARFITGANAGLEAQILTNEGSGLTLYLPAFYTPTVGDNLELITGCNRKIEVCRDKFANAINHRGFPFLPGRSKMFKLPD